MKYQLIMNLKSPMCIAKNGNTGNVIETVDYIPGSSIRGALAAHYLEKNGVWNLSRRMYLLPENKKTEFKQLFDSDEVCFNNAYPKGAKVIPLTASSCKYKKGFYHKKTIKEKEQHGVWDSLFEFVKYELMGEFNKGRFDECEDCKAPIDRFSGYYLNNSGVEFEWVKIPKRIIARTAINDTFETASSSQLYTIEVLNEGNEFIAEINERTFNLLKPIFDDIKVRIGLGKSRGFGEIEIKLWKKEKKESLINLRFDGFNDELKKITNNKYFFSLTLHSDVILLDNFLRFKSTIEINDLIDSITISEDDKNILYKFKLLRCFLSTHIVSGWNNALKLPQENAMAISKGSVFLYMSDHLPAEKEKASLINMLDKIEQYGLGEYKNKGFGKIKVCDEFHWGVSLK